MKRIVFFVTIILITIHAYPDEIETKNLSTDAKIDSIYRWQKQVYEERNISPLKGKNTGIELNLFRFLMSGEYFSMTGGYSLFNINRHAELIFPFYLAKSYGDHSTTEIDLDFHYRYFLGNNQKGFYLSGFSRYTYLHGYSGNYDYTNFTYTYNEITKNRLGLGVGLGYRIFSRKGLYWGTGLILGRYLDDRSIDFYDSSFFTFSSMPLIVDFDLLKFGWAF